MLTGIPGKPEVPRPAYGIDGMYALWHMGSVLSAYLGILGEGRLCTMAYTFGWETLDALSHRLHLSFNWLCDRYDRSLGLFDDEPLDAPNPWIPLDPDGLPPRTYPFWRKAESERGDQA